MRARLHTHACTQAYNYFKFLTFRCIYYNDEYNEHFHSNISKMKKIIFFLNN